MTPRPPIWISTMMTVFPNADQYVAVSCSTSPVTQEAETAVNSVVISGARVPSAVAIGRLKSSVPSPIRIRNPRAMICVWENFTFISISDGSFSKRMV